MCPFLIWRGNPSIFILATVIEVTWPLSGRGRPEGPSQEASGHPVLPRMASYSRHAPGQLGQHSLRRVCVATCDCTLSCGGVSRCAAGRVWEQGPWSLPCQSSSPGAWSWSSGVDPCFPEGKQPAALGLSSLPQLPGPGQRLCFLLPSLGVATSAIQTLPPSVPEEVIVAPEVALCQAGRGRPWPPAVRGCFQTRPLAIKRLRASNHKPQEEGAGEAGTRARPTASDSSVSWLRASLGRAVLPRWSRYIPEPAECCWL